jgi:hypothetical protein
VVDTPRSFARRPGIGLAKLVLAVATTGCSIFGTDNRCPEGGVYHRSSCIDPKELVVFGDRDAVARAVADFEGTIERSTFDVHSMRFTVSGVEELDQIKAELEEMGFRVGSAFVGSLLDE